MGKMLRSAHFNGGTFCLFLQLVIGEKVIRREQKKLQKCVARVKRSIQYIRANCCSPIGRVWWV